MAALMAAGCAFAALPASAQEAPAALPQPDAGAAPPDAAPPEATPAQPDPAGLARLAFRRALALADRNDWTFARAEAQAAGPVQADVIEWMRLRSGDGQFADFAAFDARNADWPGMELLRRKAEEKLTEAAPATVVAWFAHTQPQTGQGAMSLMAALQAQGRDDAARAVAEASWRSLRLTEAEETAFLARYGDILAPWHGGRMQAMLDRGETAQAQRLLPLVTPGTRAVAEARIALQRKANGVDTLLNAIPEHMEETPGLARDRATWRWRNSLEPGAADIVLERSDSAESLGDPAAWAKLRAQLARFFLRQGDARLAYKLAARHRMEPKGGDWADLEWLSGYAALKLGDAPVALRHFDRLAESVGSPISAARAAYWRGRALEILGRLDDAQAAFRTGAQWQTAYYGLLCAERVGAPLDPGFAAPAPLPAWHGGSYTASGVFQAAQLLHEAGAEELAARFILHLEESLPAEQIPPLAALAEDWGDAYLALSLAKRAAEGGAVLMQAYYPLPTLTTDALGEPEELALAIARRESEFDPAVISHAGARGLMQLMPGTAKLMATAVGLPYDQGRLTTDPTYNLQLGSAYLAKLRSEFGSSPVLVAAGYNAGPGRPRRWIEDQGDPRLPTVDVVDWVEMIPFTETRNYVMRVAESLPVYRARLGLNDTGPVRFTEELRGTPPLPQDVAPPDQP